MLSVDEEAFICDMAETYHIFNYKEVKVSLLAILAKGLRPDSRIKLKLANEEFSLNTMLMIGIHDRLSLLVYANSKDAAKGINKPKLLIDKLRKNESEYSVFDSPEEFEENLKRIKGGTK